MLRFRLTFVGAACALALVGALAAPSSAARPTALGASAKQLMNAGPQRLATRIAPRGANSTVPRTRGAKPTVEPAPRADGARVAAEPVCSGWYVANGGWWEYYCYAFYPNQPGSHVGYHFWDMYYWDGYQAVYYGSYRYFVHYASYFNELAWCPAGGGGCYPIQ